jgi:hypothetical protein
VPFATLDLGKVTGIFGLEVCILFGRLSFSILGMKVLGTGKDMQESLSCSLLVMCIVMGAKDSSGTLWENYSAGIEFSRRPTSCTKVLLVATTEVAAVAFDATDTWEGTCPWLGGGRP